MNGDVSSRGSLVKIKLAMVLGYSRAYCFTTITREKKPFYASVHFLQVFFLIWAADAVQN
jgi:hypothetical protein